jgi:tetratricopeptide (TPR) repeat protein
MVLPPDRPSRRVRPARAEPVLAEPALAVLERQAALEPAVQRHLLRAQAEHLSGDHPQQALAILDTLGGTPCALRVALLCALGRAEEAATALAHARRTSGEDERGRISIEAAQLARRRNQPKEAVRLLQEGLRFSEQPEVRGTALVRLGVVELDRGNTIAGFEALQRGRALLEACGAPRLAGMARVEEGMYRVMLGELLQGRALLERSVLDAREAGSLYLERVVHSCLALVYRLLGEPALAERARERSLSLVHERMEEPGVFALRALERRLAGDVPEAELALEEGLRRDAERPNPADAATLHALRLAWTGGKAQSMPRETPPFTRSLLHTARGDASGPKLARRIGQQLHDGLVAAFLPR